MRAGLGHRDNELHLEGVNSRMQPAFGVHIESRGLQQSCLKLLSEPACRAVEALLRAAAGRSQAFSPWRGVHSAGSCTQERRGPRRLCGGRSSCMELKAVQWGQQGGQQGQH